MLTSYVNKERSWFQYNNHQCSTIDCMMIALSIWNLSKAAYITDLLFWLFQKKIFEIFFQLKNWNQWIPCLEHRWQGRGWHKYFSFMVFCYSLTKNWSISFRGAVAISQSLLRLDGLDWSLRTLLDLFEFRSYNLELQNAIVRNIGDTAQGWNTWPIIDTC